MEPRPQQPRQPTGPRNPSPGQTPAGDPSRHTSPYQPGAGYEPPQPEYPGGYDPSTVVAPPRSEYDYSPLDLAPPDQRRRRQLIAGAIGALSIILLGALVVFAWTLLRDESPNSDQNNQVAIATRVTDDPDTGAAGTPPATLEPTSAPAEPTAPAATEEPTTPAQSGVKTDEASLTALLPDVSDLPPGFEVTNESSLTQADVVAALGDS
ncbi:MAG TPA: hypothetical protein VNZ58_06795, partial [Thermomicrobiales bacterium]|nr:hypothetical protein [Thermomicrobiales bacterium]